MNFPKLILTKEEKKQKEEFDYGTFGLNQRDLLK
jgi:hypothetical protein